MPSNGPLNEYIRPLLAQSLDESRRVSDRVSALDKLLCALATITSISGANFKTVPPKQVHGLPSLLKYQSGKVPAPIAEFCQSRPSAAVTTAVRWMKDENIILSFLAPVKLNLRLVRNAVAFIDFLIVHGALEVQHMDTLWALATRDHVRTTLRESLLKYMSEVSGVFPDTAVNCAGSKHATTDRSLRSRLSYAKWMSNHLYELHFRFIAGHACYIRHGNSGSKQDNVRRASEAVWCEHCISGSHVAINNDSGCGVFNAGNLCHVNCLLQIMFRVVPLRAALIDMHRIAPKTEEFKIHRAIGALFVGMEQRTLSVGDERRELPCAVNFVDASGVYDAISSMVPASGGNYFLQERPLREVQWRLHSLLWLEGTESTDCSDGEPALRNEWNCMLSKQFEGCTITTYTRQHGKSCQADKLEPVTQQHTASFGLGGAAVLNFTASTNSFTSALRDHFIVSSPQSCCDGIDTATIRFSNAQLPTNLFFHIVMAPDNTLTGKPHAAEDAQRKRFSIPQVLDMRPFVDSTPTDKQYRVKAVVTHLAASCDQPNRSGHYIVYVRSNSSDLSQQTSEDSRKWYKFDDSVYEPVLLPHAEAAIDVFEAFTGLPVLVQFELMPDSPPSNIAAGATDRIVTQLAVRHSSETLSACECGLMQTVQSNSFRNFVLSFLGDLTRNCQLGLESSSAMRQWMCISVVQLLLIKPHGSTDTSCEGVLLCLCSIMDELRTATAADSVLIAGHSAGAFCGDWLDGFNLKVLDSWINTIGVSAKARALWARLRLRV